VTYAGWFMILTSGGTVVAPAGVAGSPCRVLPRSATVFSLVYAWVPEPSQQVEQLFFPFLQKNWSVIDGPTL
jgi:hypothetical protein